MEKKQKNSFDAGPWVMKPAGIKKLSAVTELNRKNAIQMGRILYIVDIPSKTFRGTIVVEPCYLKGEWKIPFRPWQAGFPGHFSAVFREDMNFTDLKNNNTLMINKFIAEKNLFINPSDPILKFYHIK